jgi:hypothetical protein
VRRPARLALAGVAGAIALGAIAIAILAPGDPFAAYRQTRAQRIPGALGFALAPPPAGSVPGLTPRDVRTRYPAGGGRVWVSYASIRDTLEGRTIGPGWVLVARGVCLRNAKGELVSDARGTDPLDLDCTDATLWVLAVDADTGEPLVALTGYDPGGSWAPARSG